MNPSPRVYRNESVLRRRWRRGLVLAITPAVALVVLAVIYLFMEEPNIAAGLVVTAVIVGLPFGLLVLSSSRRWKLVRVEVDDAGITVVNRRETRRLSWYEVGGFEVHWTWDPANGGSPAVVRLRLGSTVQLQAAGTRVNAESFIRRLREEFDAVLRRSVPPPPASPPVPPVPIDVS